MMELNELQRLVRDVPDFPKPGIMFRDITPLIGDARAFAAMVDMMAAPFLGKVDTVLGQAGQIALSHDRRKLRPRVWQRRAPAP
jgi:adenine/guanine phosphoribosyltransferase-like PRPP-binding protein